METVKGLKRSVINLYGLPSFGFQLMVNMEVLYFAAFLTDFALIPTSIATSVLLITSVFDIVWVPTAGILLEKSNFKFGGKYRSWLLIGPPFAALFFLFQFFKAGDNHVLNATVITIGFVVSHLIWNIHYAAHIAMNNSMTTVREERISMASNRGMFNALGSIVFSAIGLNLATAIGKSLGNPAIGFTLTVVITGIVMVLCHWSLYGLTKEYAFHGTAQSSDKQDKMSIGEMLSQIIVNPPLIGLMLAELGRYLGRFVIFGLAFYYFKYVVNDLIMLPIFMTGLNVVCFFGALFTNPLAKKFGERNTYILSLAIFIIGLFIVWIVPMNAMTFTIVMFVTYLGYGMPDALGVAMYSSTVDYGEWKTGKNARGFIMSLISFPIKVAIFARSVIIGVVLTTAGYIADMEATPTLIQGLKNGIALVPSIFIGIGLIIIIFLYKITPERQKQMQEEIAARK